MKSDLPYLAHIADSIAAIEEYTRDGRNAFMRERLIQDAVVRNFEIIGEAAGRQSPTTRRSAEPRWKEIVAFRNRLIHGHWSIDLSIVWHIIENNLRELKSEVDRLRRELGS